MEETQLVRYTLSDLFEVAEKVGAFVEPNAYEHFHDEHFKPWTPVVDRSCPTKPHGIVLPVDSLKEDPLTRPRVIGRVSTDISTIVFEETQLPAGQYWRAPNTNEYIKVPEATNIGGSHAVVVDTSQPGTSWSLVARAVDCGSPFGIRIQFVALARSDATFISDERRGNDSKDECRALMHVTDITLPTGRVFIIDAAHSALGTSDDTAVLTGIGDGFYPVQVEHDPADQIWRVNVAY